VRSRQEILCGEEEGGGNYQSATLTIGRVLFHDLEKMSTGCMKIVQIFI